MDNNNMDMVDYTNFYKRYMDREDNMDINYYMDQY
jgi:hypothetical protein